MDDFKALCERHEYECHNIYINNRTVMRLTHIPCGTEFDITPEAFKRKKCMCHVCADGYRRKLDFVQVKAFVERVDWELMSSTYKNELEILDLICPKGHNNKINFKNFKRRIICDQCIGREIMTIEKAKEVCKERGFILLADEYKNDKTPMKVQCIKSGHLSVKCFSLIKIGIGCPECSGSKTESLVRQFLEEITTVKFPKNRPKWLGGLELDCYNVDDKIAVEYQGLQHSKEVPFFHRTEDAFKKQQERDARKRQLCKENGVLLLEIPHTYDYRKPGELRDYIEKMIICAYIDLEHPLECGNIVVHEYPKKLMLSVGCLECKDTHTHTIEKFKEMIWECYPKCCMNHECSVYFKA
jgi:hypothetical protein